MSSKSVEIQDAADENKIVELNKIASVQATRGYQLTARATEVEQSVQVSVFFPFILADLLDNQSVIASFEIQDTADKNSVVEVDRFIEKAQYCIGTDQARLAVYAVLAHGLHSHFGMK